MKLSYRIFYFSLACMIAGVVAFTPAFDSVYAQSTSPDTLLQQLQEQLTQLQQKLNELRGNGVTQQRTFFTQNLSRGMQSDGVRQLQEFLARSSEIYPEGLVTGFFGSLTEAAVRRFQATHNIPIVGVVGPQTRAQLNTLISEGREPDGVRRVDIAIEIDINEEDLRQTPPAVEREVAPVDSDVPTEGEFALRPQPQYDRGEIERRVLEIINEERRSRGLGTMEWNDALALVSERHSFDQSVDNRTLTDPTKPCAYPLLRHEGFTFGHTVGERLHNSDIRFRTAGENLVLFPLTKNLVYRFRQSEEAVSCPRVASFDLSRADTQQEQETLLRQAIRDRTQTLEQVRSVNWVNREWLTIDEIARRAVDLWLDSPGHRDNMLNPVFTESGIGVVIANDYVVITHVLMR